jgi:hypothetical protein
VLYRAKGTDEFKGWQYAIKFFTLSIDFVRERSMHEQHDNTPSHSHFGRLAAARVVEFVDNTEEEVCDMHGFPFPSFVVMEWREEALARNTQPDAWNCSGAPQVCTLHSRIFPAEGFTAHCSTAERARIASVNPFYSPHLCLTQVLTESRSRNILMHVVQSYLLTDTHAMHDATYSARLRDLYKHSTLLLSRAVASEGCRCR